MKNIIIALVICLIPSCLPSLPGQVSGSKVPTEHTFNLTDSDVIAAKSAECLQTWLTGNAEDDLVTAHSLLNRHHVKIKEGNPSGFSTAFRYLLWVPKGFSKKSTVDKVVLLSHELVHYCQRTRVTHSVFERAMLTSPGRFIYETPAYLQTFNALATYCVSPKTLSKKISARQESFRNKYWLWDIDPAQYEQLTGDIWGTALTTPVPPSCTPPPAEDDKPVEPVEPAPTEPTKPAPTEPAPVEPTEPAPVKPAPTEPAPTEPAKPADDQN